MALGIARMAFACLVFSTAPRLCAGEVKTPSGDLRPSELADLKPHRSNSKTYNEFWTYHFILDGNIQAYLNFSRVNLGSFKSPVCGADFTVLGFKGRNYSVAREYDKKNFVFLDALHQLQVHQNIWFSGKLPDMHRVYFSTKKNDVTYYMDLGFSEILPGQVWGDGMFKLGSETVGIFMHIPRAKVRGRLAINGDTVDVSGTAYMDHTFQTTLAPELVDAGYRYISQNGSLEAGYFLDPISRFGSKPVGYGLRQVEGGFTLLKPASLSAASSGKAMGVKVPTRLEIAFQDGTKAVLDRREDRLQQSYLHEFSGPLQMGHQALHGRGNPDIQRPGHPERPTDGLQFLRRRLTRPSAGLRTFSPRQPVPSARPPSGFRTRLPRSSPAGRGRRSASGCRWCCSC